jgi:hypothetical protein
MPQHRRARFFGAYSAVATLPHYPVSEFMPLHCSYVGPVAQSV